MVEKLAEGQVIWISDGDGAEVQAKIESLTPYRVTYSTRKGLKGRFSAKKTEATRRSFRALATD